MQSNKSELNLSNIANCCYFLYAAYYTQQINICGCLDYYRGGYASISCIYTVRYSSR